MLTAKRVFWIVAILAMVVSAILISLEAYYITIALVLGLPIIGHREIWSLLTRRKLPPLDERVRDNLGKSLRNGFIFFVVSLPLLMLPFTTIISREFATEHILGGLFVAGALVYALSYVHYDRIFPKLSTGGAKMLKLFLLIAGIGLGVGILSIFLHNFISGLLNTEEPVFFTIAVFLSPLAVAVGIIGGIVIALKGLLTKSP